ncbi:hypothetical protein NQ318_003257 [Aromia moschata]|uniref:Transferrin-like domain-containing protein n=1 Tax=Aromia moschata TaxID=1265417 RepID=A0AAV8XR89_9CUCU|nr:hypothetical protein NQ318_003257 [Aromia moschata]
MTLELEEMMDIELLTNIVVESERQSFWKTTQFKDNKPREKQFNITWCTISKEEHKKCLNFAMANERDQIKVGYERAEITCKSASTKDECMQLLDEGNVTMTTLDAGSVYVGGRYHSLVPIAQEVLQGGFKFYYGVAVIKKRDT